MRNIRIPQVFTLIHIANNFHSNKKAFPIHTKEEEMLFPFFM